MEVGSCEGVEEVGGEAEGEEGGEGSVVED